MSRRLAFSLCLAGALVGCATGGRREPEGPEFVGRALEVVAANGQQTVLRFRPDGIVTARFNDQESEGRWTFEGRELCFTWRQTFRECWPETPRLREGRPVTIRSDRGNAVTVTLRD